MLVPLVACGQEPSAPTPKQSITVRSEGQKAMHRLNDLNRAIALKRAIYDSGAQCLRITKSGYVGTYENTEQWTATCEDRFKRTRDWALYVGADDSVQVRLCEDVVKAGLPACVIKDEPKSPAAT
jgi:hypothetical protein